MANTCCTMVRLNLIIAGFPGSGKGTQAKKIAKHYGLKHVSSGELLREEAEKDSSPYAQEINKLASSGKLYPDDLVKSVLLERVPSDNFILDGYPRKLSQVETFKNIDLVIFLTLSEKEAIKRISLRKEGRPDDNAKTAETRISVFLKDTKPVMDYFSKKGLLVEIDGGKTIDIVFSAIREAIYKRFQV